MVSWDIQHWTLEEWFPNNWDNSHTAQARTNTWNIENPKYRNVPDPVSVSPCRRVSRDRHRNAVCRILDLCCSHLTSLYANYFYRWLIVLGPRKRREGWQILHQFFVEWVITQAPISQYTWAPTSYIMLPVTGDCGCGLMMNVTSVSSGPRASVQGPSVNHAIGGQP